VIDAQSVKTSANVAETSQGIDANKKIKGRERHLITGTLGLVLAVLITARTCTAENACMRPGGTTWLANPVRAGDTHVNGAPGSPWVQENRRFFGANPRVHRCASDRCIRGFG
jgi:hypothetical protein